jgi:hypothetical protein
MPSRPDEHEQNDEHRCSYGRRDQDVLPVVAVLWWALCHVSTSTVESLE